MFCLATLADLPEVWALMAQHQDGYVDDYETLTVEWVIELIQGQQVWVVYSAKHYKSLIALLWWTDRVAGLHVTLHALLSPLGLREFYSRVSVLALLQAIATQAGVSGMQAFPMAHQRGAVKLLKHFGFSKKTETQPTISRYRGEDCLVSQYNMQLF
jgi:hypothetical protein